MEIEYSGHAWNGTAYETEDEYRARLNAAREHEEELHNAALTTETSDFGEVVMLERAATRMASDARVIDQARAVAQHEHRAAMERLRLAATEDEKAVAQAGIAKAEQAMHKLRHRPLHVVGPERKD